MGVSLTIFFELKNNGHEKIPKILKKKQKNSTKKNYFISIFYGSKYFHKKSVFVKVKALISITFKISHQT